MTEEMKYDVALSFSGEDRRFVEEVATVVRFLGHSVFYDSWEQHELWGQDLYTYFADVFSKRARFCVMFISETYAERVWPSHERRFAQARQLFSTTPYILPVVLREAEIPGIPATLGFLDASGKPPSFVAVNIVRKLGALREAEDPSATTACFEYILKKHIHCQVTESGDFIFRAEHQLLYLGGKKFRHMEFYEDSMDGRPLEVDSLVASDKNGPLNMRLTRKYETRNQFRIDLRQPLKFGEEIVLNYEYRCRSFYADLQSSCSYSYTTGRTMEFRFMLSLPAGYRFTQSAVNRSFKQDTVGTAHEVLVLDGQECVEFHSDLPPSGTVFELEFAADKGRDSNDAA